MITSGAELDGIPQVIGCKVCIAHGHGQAGMAQDFLQREDVSAVHDEVTGKRMA